MRAALLAGVAAVSQAGYRLSFTIVDESALVQDIRAVMCDALIIYRPVLGPNDPSPRGDQDVFWTGADWMQKLWAAQAAGTGATYYQFVNEWMGNRDKLAVYGKFASFYIQLGVSGLARGMPPTLGDFSMGTPPDADDSFEGPRFTALAPLFTFAAQYHLPINGHLYSPDGAGAFDMAPGKDSYVMRWEQTVSRYPGLTWLAGEGGNYGAGNGPYSTKTPALMKQAVQMVRASPYRSQLLAINWWGVVSEQAHPDWKGVDCSPCFPWFFSWCMAGQPI